MRQGNLGGWLLGALTALAILALASVLAPGPSVAPTGLSEKPQTAAAPQAAIPAPQAAGQATSAEAALPAPSGPAPQVSSEAPAAGDSGAADASPPAPAAGEARPSLSQAGSVADAPGRDALPRAEPAPQHDVLLEPAPFASADPAPAVAPDPGGAAPRVPDRLPQPQVLALAPEAPPAPAQGPDASPKAEGTPTFEDGKPSTLPGVGTLAVQAPAVKTNALPQIGKPVPGGGDLPQIGEAAAPAQVAVSPAGATPLQLYARAFTPIDPGKPKFVILLRDIGDKGMARDDLLRLPFPVSVVLDPLAPDAPQVMQAWRGAGQEVLLAATGLPEGATASDVAQTFQALTTALPQTVAVIDLTGAAFQNDRPLASLVVPEIWSGGRGLVTWAEGLDAADQIARRDGVPAARIFRHLDGNGESRAAIRRYLDRATFKAAQDGSVVVLGDTSPDTVAAILEWTMEGKAADVNLAPLTAVLAPAP